MSEIAASIHPQPLLDKEGRRELIDCRHNPGPLGILSHLLWFASIPTSRKPNERANTYNSEHLNEVLDVTVRYGDSAFN